MISVFTANKRARMQKNNVILIQKATKMVACFSVALGIMVAWKFSFGILLLIIC